MTLLKTFTTMMNENAAGGAFGSGGSAGGMAMPLFSRLVQRSKPKAKEDEFVGREEEQKTVEPTPIAKKSKLKETFDRLMEAGEEDGIPARPGSSTFDTTEVISKLKALENRESQDHRDTVTFGLEDDNGGLVRVAVKHEQAEDFEKALQAVMADAEREEDDRPEIAEILFKLKDRFDLVDVQWPDVQEDEEQQVDLQGGAEGEIDPDSPGELGDEMGGEMELGGGADTSQVQDLLSQVIDMMKADAEARTADARAREAEAKNKEAESIARQAALKVKQEEQFLDMDTYNKAKKEEEKESKRLAQLSKWKHEMGGSADDEDDITLTRTASLSAPEEEETTLRRPQQLAAQRTPKRPALRGRVHPHEIASFILNRVK